MSNLAEYINYNFDILNYQLLEEIILKIYRFYEASEHVASILLENFNGISDILKQLILDMSSSKELSKSIAGTLTYKFYNIPKDFRNKILERFVVSIDSVEFVVHILKESYSKIPSEIAKRLLIESCRFDYAIFYKMKLIQFRFDELSKEEANILLIHLSKHQLVSKKLIATIKKYSEHIEINILFELLSKLLDFDESKKYSVMLTRDFISEFTKEQKEKLFSKLIESKQYSKITSFLLSKQYLQINNEFANSMLQKLSLENDALNGITACLLKFEVDKELAKYLLEKLIKANYSQESLTLIRKKYNFAD
ncbi:MAG: hypothetical protein ACK4IX_06870 [Candidatus Sericytochromatia bacterium]